MMIMLSVWCVIRIIYIMLVVHFIGEIGYIYWAYPLTWRSAPPSISFITCALTGCTDLKGDSMSSPAFRFRLATLDDAPALLSIYAPYVEKTAISFEYDVPSLDEFRLPHRGYLAQIPLSRRGG